ncbi:MAG: hypothetical protein ABJF04_09220 [Reichenbachiella sp.]|uniref:hypothetical protein n=1 Tax=Reichenbachiella sp. TaxID=2184521 RepID=UPI0032634C04
MKQVILAVLMLLPIVAKAQIQKIEYFFDQDPGLGKATSVVITEGNEVDMTFTADVSNLSNGLHLPHSSIRSKWPLVIAQFQSLHSARRHRG